MFNSWNLVFEGGVGAGKSSTCALLEKNYGYYHVKEYMSFVGNSEGAGLSMLPPKERFRFFLNIEKARIDNVWASSGHRPLAIDRCFLSILAFEFGQRSMGKDSVSADDIHALGRDEEFRILVPDKLVFLDLPEEDRAKRVGQRDKVVRGDLVSPEFNDAIRVFFKRIQGNFNVEWIRSDNFSPIEIANQFSSLDENKETRASGGMASKIPEIFLEAYIGS